MNEQISVRLQFGLIALGIGLIVVGVASLVLLLRLRPGQHTEDAVRRVVRNSAFPLGIQFVVRAVDFAFAMVLYRMAAQDAVGDYHLAALLVVLYLGTISEWGLSTLLTREVARDPSAIRHSFGTALVLRLGLALLSLPLALLAVVLTAGLERWGLIAEAITGRGMTLVLLLALTLVPSALASAVTAIFVAMERPLIPAVANLFNNALSTGVRVLALVLNFGVIGVAWGALAATVINALVFVWLLRRHFGWPGWGWDGSLAGSMLLAAFPLMLNNLLVVAFFRFDMFIVKAFQGSDAVANYNAAYQVAQLGLIVPPIVVNALFPRFSRQARDDPAGLARGYRLTLRVLLVLVLPFTVITSVLAPAAVRLLAGPEYVPVAAPALAVLIWFLPLSFVNGIAQYVLIALNRQGAITRAFAVTAAFNFAANLLLVPRWGIAAAALVTIVSELVLYVPFRRILRSELSDVGVAPLLVRPAAAALLAGAAILPLRDQPVVAVMVGALVYGMVLWLLGAFTEEDQRLVDRLLGRTG